MSWISPEAIKREKDHSVNKLLLHRTTQGRELWPFPELSAGMGLAEYQRLINKQATF
jgi:hypothetical protein